MRTTTAVLLALVASTTANPISSKRQDDEMDEYWPSKEVYCKWDLTTPGAVQERWDNYMITASMDNFLTSYDRDEVLDINWLNEWVKELDVDGGRSDASGCGSIAGHCDPAEGVSCHEFVERAEANGREEWFIRDSYWVLQSVKGMHSKFGELSRLMTKDTLVTGFRIPEMIKAFAGSNENAAEALTWIAAAIGMGGTAAGTLPGPGSAISAGAGIVSGIINQAIQDGDGPVDAADMTTSLIDAFVAASGALEKTLKITTGLGKTKEDFLTLPAPHHDLARSKIAKFFNGGWFLLEDSSQAVQDLLSSVSNNMQRKVASDIMNGAGWELIVDRREHLDNEDKCHTQRGRHWLEFKDGKFHCFYIAKVTVEDGRNSKYRAAEEAGEGFYDSMVKYGFESFEVNYYKSVLDCALNGGEDKELDMSNVAFGHTPLCYFKLGTKFADVGSGCSSGFAWACEHPNLSELE